MNHEALCELNSLQQAPTWGAEHDLRPETPEEKDSNMGKKERELENVKEEPFSNNKLPFKICLKLSLTPGTEEWEKVGEKILLVYLLRLIIASHNPL